MFFNIFAFIALQLVTLTPIEGNISYSKKTNVALTKFTTGLIMHQKR
jgi:hypothetical protein